MKISKTILSVFQLKNEKSAKAAHKFMANLDYSFFMSVNKTQEALPFSTDWLLFAFRK